MPVYRLPESHVFPPADHAEPSGLLAVGGDLHPRRIVMAYAQGIFPWYSEGDPILWFSPDPRCVLEPQSLHLGRSLKKRIRRGDYEIRLDTAFEAVIRECRAAGRPGQTGTWITDDMERAYIELHRMGFAHSAEAWKDGQLVGGLYGVAIGHVFSGESMFAHASDASKVAFVWLVRQLTLWGFDLIDCQIETDHLQRFGAQPLSREAFLERLNEGLQHPRQAHPWRFDPLFHPLSAA
ncbi:MAG: leucyl/phenylalanyl-tRNA--protein transferase [Deltaproteobacteria bacterium]|nr:leucyl/phenylalanyl-tRNA--protein transferase [Deltaproteobacteria bacterium]HCH62958.1 leucyl/phenylalanyl-tRNA--protein transferase [Deltaproteobacteria bacterium]